MSLDIKQEERDYSGMSSLLSARTRLLDARGDLAIVIAQPSHLGLITEAHLEAVFEVAHDEQDAIHNASSLASADL